jgi:ABC-2 type transport system ATP-binding protein
MGGVDVIQVHVIDPADLDRVVTALAPLGAEPPRIDVPTRSVAIPVAEGSARLLEAVRIIDSLGVSVADVGLRRATLDEVFLKLTGRTAEADPADADASGKSGRKRRKAAAAA